MVGRISGAVTMPFNDCESGIFRIWCGTHQLDLAIQAATDMSTKDYFYRPLTHLISYLRRQTNFVTSMGTQCPKVATTRWISFGIVCQWFVKNLATVKEYLESKKPPQEPDNCVWIMLHAFSSIMATVNI